MWHGYHGWEGMWPFPIIMIIAIGLILYVIFRPAGSSHTREETALDILKKRYARGEINKDEFEGMKKDIS